MKISNNEGEAVSKATSQTELSEATESLGIFELFNLGAGKPSNSSGKTSCLVLFLKV